MELKSKIVDFFILYQQNKLTFIKFSTNMELKSKIVGEYLCHILKEQ